MPAHLVAVLGAEVDALEAVERVEQVPVRVVVPAVRRFHVDRAVRVGPPHRLREAGGRRQVALGRVLAFEERRHAGHVLQVALAQERRPVAVHPHQVDEGVGAQIERRAVRAHAVQRWHPPGHQGRAVRHADRRRDIEPVEAPPALGDRVDMGRPKHRMPRAGEVVRALLVGDDEKEVRAIGHCVVLVSCRHGRRRPTIHAFLFFHRGRKTRGWSASADHDGLGHGWERFNPTRTRRRSVRRTSRSRRRRTCAAPRRRARS